MKDFEKLGLFYIGKEIDKETSDLLDNPLLIESKNLTTHAICLGMTGSGKTGLGIVLLEEACLDRIPSLVIDPKGDLTNLLLTFPNLSADEFSPWIDPLEAERKNMDLKSYSEFIAQKWQEKLAEWDQSAERIKALKNSVEMNVYTPASNAGIPLSILNSFAAPSKEVNVNPDTWREKILSTTSGLLSLIGINEDPLNCREHILISQLISQNWQQGIDVNLPLLIQQIQKPPFEKIGIMDMETFYPLKERTTLSIQLNQLLASPGFQAWMEGEPLDIQQMLYTKEGKPRCAILSIAHLSDKERMFFVSLFLNELLTWVRRQPGTSSLRALLYIDEIFGYFPPVANPPSKLPLITLLKQARAFGLGIILTTQNPVDLDYKGLANCGIWFIGKLQTERDKGKVFEGIKSISGTEITTDAFNKMISLTGNQKFILLSVYENEPLLFKSRWALSYLRGPLTLNQIQRLNQQKPFKEQHDISSLTTSLTPESQPQLIKPLIPPGIDEFFANRAILRDQVQYHPMIAGIAKLHFVDEKKQIDTWQNVFWIAPADPEGTSIRWELGENRPEVKNVLEKTPWPNASFKAAPSGLLQEKNYKNFEKSFDTFLFEHQLLTIYHARDFKLNSRLGENESDFRVRVSLGMREKRDEIVNELREKYQTKIETLKAKIQRAQENKDKQKQQSTFQKADTFISIGAAILGALLGRNVTKGTINQAGSSIKKAGRIHKESQDVLQAEESYKNYQQQLLDLEKELEQEIFKALEKTEISNLKIDKTLIRLRKNNIFIEKLILLWWPETTIQ